jgi:hypothetical protein
MHKMRVLGTARRDLGGAALLAAHQRPNTISSRFRFLQSTLAICLAQNGERKPAGPALPGALACASLALDSRRRTCQKSKK